MCVEAVVWYGGLTLALVLPTRATTTVAIVFLVFLLRARGFGLSTASHLACLPTAVRLTFVTEVSGVRVQAASRVN